MQCKRYLETKISLDPDPKCDKAGISYHANNLGPEESGSTILLVCSLRNLYALQKIRYRYIIIYIFKSLNSVKLLGWQTGFFRSD